MQVGVFVSGTGSPRVGSISGPAVCFQNLPPLLRLIFLAQRIQQRGSKGIAGQAETADNSTASILLILDIKRQKPQKFHYFVSIISVVVYHSFQIAIINSQQYHA
jgi:hypothetical protein